MAKLIAFIALTLILIFENRSSVVDAVNQFTALFAAANPGQIPIAGATTLTSTAASSVIECGNSCWNRNIGQCQGFVFRPTSCVAIGAGICDTLQFSDNSSLVIGPAVNSSCQRFYTKRSSSSTIQGFSASLTYVIPGNLPIFAVTGYSDLLFVTRLSVNQVALYNTSTFQLINNIAIPGMSDNLEGVAYCPLNNCLFVSDFNNKTIFTLNMTTNAVSSWSLPFNPRGLSVTKAGNVLVALNSNSWQEYMPNGTLVRQQSDHNWIWQAVEVSNGIVATSRYNPQHGVAIRTVNGANLYSYGTVAGSGPGQVNKPCSLVVDSEGYILLAESAGSNRIIALNPTLSEDRNISLPVNANTPINQPFGLWLDESRGRLYVGEYGGLRRVLVYDVSKISAAFLQ